LLYYLSILVKKSKRNWFIGIRTPWTLSSDKVWDKTSRLGSKLLKITAILILIGAFFGEYLIYFILIPIILTFVYLWVYSYLEFKKV